MRRNRWRFTACLALLTLVATTGHLHSEVSATPGPSTVGTIVLGIIEGPDPIPQVIWEPIRDVDPSLFLNPEGAARGDGRPDIASDPLTGWPHVVWARQNGSEHDIAYSRWDGNGWTATEFLTATTADLVDPAIHVDEVGIHVVWWDADANSVWLVSRPHASAWLDVETEHVGVGMRPTVATWGGTVLVAYETAGGQGSKDIIVSTRLGPDDFDPAVSRAVAGDQPLDIVLHSEQDRLWMDWRQSATEFAYSRFTGTDWSATTAVPWTDQSWVRLEEVRLIIRGIVLGAP